MPQYPSLAAPTRPPAPTVRASSRKLWVRATVFTGLSVSMLIDPSAPSLVTNDQCNGCDGTVAGCVVSGSGGGAPPRPGRPGGGVCRKNHFFINSSCKTPPQEWVVSFVIRPQNNSTHRWAEWYAIVV